MPDKNPDDSPGADPARDRMLRHYRPAGLARWGIAALAVAIPAVFGYNLFANRLNRIDSELEGFGSELIALLVREGRI